jgi:Protein of unknown function (DUF2934)
MANATTADEPHIRTVSDRFVMSLGTNAGFPAVLTEVMPPAGGHGVDRCIQAALEVVDTRANGPYRDVEIAARQTAGILLCSLLPARRRNLGMSPNSALDISIDRARPCDRSAMSNPMQKKSLDVPTAGTVSVPTADVQHSSIQGHSVATKDHAVIRSWAARHRAEPATGEATASGPATIGVNDGGAGIRFNFPGAGFFRAITWNEWFEHLDRHHLVFVYDEEVADRAHALWQARGGAHGHDLRDWFDAERELNPGSIVSSARYRFVPDAQHTP